MCSRLCLRAELGPMHSFICGLSVVDILEFCLLVVGNLTGRGSLPHGRKLLLPLLQDGGNSTSNLSACRHMFVIFTTHLFCQPIAHKADHSLPASFHPSPLLPSPNTRTHATSVTWHFVDAKQGPQGALRMGELAVYGATH